MFRFRLTALVVLLATVSSFLPSALGQTMVLPRNIEKLKARVEQYWNALKAGKRNTAAQFVVAADRDAFVAVRGALIQKVQIEGLGLTGDLNRALVHARLEELPVGATDMSRRNLTDTWVWKDNNWFLALGNSNETIFQMPADAEFKQVQKEFESSLRLDNNVFDIGTVTKGPVRTFRVPFHYSGKTTVSVEAQPPLTFIYSREYEMPPSVDSFPVSIETDKISGEFVAPVRLRFWSGVAFVEKNLIVKGTVFAPLTFRSSGQIGPEQRLSVFVKNNTAEVAEIMYFTAGDDKFDILSAPEMIGPQQEAEVILVVHPDQKPESLGVLLKKPLAGLAQFGYRFEPAR